MKASVAPAPQLRWVGLIVSTVSLGIIALATLLPGPDIELGPRLCLVCGSLGGVNAVLNLLLFAPLGVGFALLGLSGRCTVLAGLAGSILIEATQLLVIPGRYATIGDVAMNTAGIAFGFMIGRFGRRWLHPSRRMARGLAAGWGAIWIMMQVISCFGLALSLPDSQYYGQLGRAFANFAVFPGTVLGAHVGKVAIPNTRLANSEQVKGLLAEGAEVGTTAVPGRTPTGFAPIVRVVDARNDEIVLLGQNDRDFIFSINTGAGILRLHPLTFALTNVFRAQNDSSFANADTMLLTGRYRVSSVQMQARSSVAASARAMTLAPSLGWVFWMPFQWFIEGTRAEYFISYAWSALLMVPLGYWAAYAVKRHPEMLFEHVGFMLVVGISLLLVGLALVPATFGFPPPPIGDWSAALVGAAVGAALGAHFKAPGAQRDRVKA